MEGVRREREEGRVKERVRGGGESKGAAEQNWKSWKSCIVSTAETDWGRGRRDSQTGLFRLQTCCNHFYQTTCT